MDVEDTKRYLRPLLLYSSPKADSLYTGNLQEPRHGMERKSRGRLRPFLEFSDFLDDDHISNHSPISRRPITLIYRHENSREFGGESQTSSTKATEIPALIHVSWLTFKLGGRDQKVEAQVYHNSELQMSFSRWISRYLCIFCAKVPVFGKDIICLRLCSERVQSGRYSL